ncbi:hypothetical protein [Piscinibacter koreensis]|uniref:Uncharacterized protein n=1 Tax=Piscinibacter koreensis TaxID=2742824 RepID=A0A7Y6NJD3_9BURK|nr:hypothetical protein [Schlegelella koreensis]NUZ04273.1 hypothetical protein [Schlegelella koreensis]
MAPLSPGLAAAFAGAAAPRQLLLFSGHMVDAPDRAVPRFPPAHVAGAAERIDAALAALGAGPADVGLTQGAAGADLLFAEACIARGVRLYLLLPFAVPEFIERSVLPSADGEAWRRRFESVQPHLAAPPFEAPCELGALAPEENPFERCNAWLLRTALHAGIERLRFVCLWDGAPGGAGGTGQMVDSVRGAGAPVTWIDSRGL